MLISFEYFELLKLLYRKYETAIGRGVIFTIWNISTTHAFLQLKYFFHPVSSKDKITAVTKLHMMKGS